MKTNMIELNLNEMKEINGGYSIDEFLHDALIVVAFGPLGEGYVAGKAIGKYIGKKMANN